MEGTLPFRVLVRNRGEHSSPSAGSLGPVLALSHLISQVQLTGHFSF